MTNDSKTDGIVPQTQAGRERLARRLAGKRLIVLEELVDVELDGIASLVRCVEGFDTVDEAIAFVESRKLTLTVEFRSRYPNAQSMEPRAENRALVISQGNGGIRLERTLGYRLGDREHYFSASSFWDILQVGADAMRDPVEALVAAYGHSDLLDRFQQDLPAD